MNEVHGFISQCYANGLVLKHRYYIKVTSKVGANSIQHLICWVALYLLSAHDLDSKFQTEE